jgi:signal transduction histidine kinase
VSRTSRRALVGIGLVSGVVIGIVAETAWNPGVDVRVVAADLAVGWAVLGGGIAAWAGRPDSVVGRLMVAVGLAWFAGTMWPALEFLHRGPLFHLLATYPTGRLAARPTNVEGRLRLLAVVGMYALSLTRFAGVAVVALTVGVAFLWIGAEGLVGARGTMRRAKLSPSIAGISIGLLMIIGNGARVAGSPPGLDFLFAYDAILAVAAVGLAIDLLAGRWSEGIVTRVVVDLGDAAQAGTVRDRLARALGDPTLVLGYGVDGRTDSFVDEDGRPVTMPSSGAGRVVTPMIVSGRETGSIAHDAAVLDDPRLVATISAATELAMSNASMQAQVRARVAEVDASRERLVHAADSQRRRLERLLQAGAARRLERVADLLARIAATRDPARSTLASLREDLARAQGELADFARGVHPAVLTTAGLVPALADLVQRTPLHVELAVDVRRADPLTESTLYFVCSEGLANAAKHAGAERIAIDIRDVGDALHLTISDDGSGGARLATGGGLRGLADRVEALGGRFAVESRSGSGSRIVVDLPRRRARVTTVVPHSPATATIVETHR